MIIIPAPRIEACANDRFEGMCIWQSPIAVIYLANDPSSR